MTFSEVLTDGLVDRQAPGRTLLTSLRISAQISSRRHPIPRLTADTLESRGQARLNGNAPDSRAAEVLMPRASTGLWDAGPAGDSRSAPAFEPLGDLLEALDPERPLGEAGVISRACVLEGLAGDGRARAGLVGSSDRLVGSRIANRLEEVEVPCAMAGLALGESRKRPAHVGGPRRRPLCDSRWRLATIGMRLAGKGGFRLCELVRSDLA